MPEENSVKVEVEEPKETEILVEDKEIIDVDGGPGEDHPRFKQVYGKWQSAKRTIEENQTTMESMQKHNKKMAEALDRTATAQEKQADATIEAVEQGKRDKVQSQQNDIYSGLMKEKLQALEEGDHAKVMTIDDKLWDMKLAQQKVVSTKAPDEAPLPANHLKAIGAFESKASGWYGINDAMTQAAVEVEKVVIADPAWQNKSYTDRYNEVQKRVETQFNYKPNGGGEAARNNSVEGGSNVRPASGQQTVKLTPEEVTVAKGMGISLQEYAKQKRDIAKSKGGKQ